jgi:hypothetical protein
MACIPCKVTINDPRADAENTETRSRAGSFVALSLILTIISSEPSQRLPSQKTALVAARSLGLHSLARTRRSAIAKYLQNIDVGLKWQILSCHGSTLSCLGSVQRTVGSETPTRRCATRGAKHSVNNDSHSEKVIDCDS